MELKRGCVIITPTGHCRVSGVDGDLAAIIRDGERVWLQKWQYTIVQAARRTPLQWLRDLLGRGA